MAGSIQSGDSKVIASINVTPFVDVVLVLLVIFMITAPVILKDVLEVKLPKAESATQSSKEDTIGVAVTEAGRILLNGEVVIEDVLSARVRELVARNPKAQAIVAADEKAMHRDVVRAIDLIRTAGLERFAIQIEKKKQN